MKVRKIGVLLLVLVLMTTVIIGCGKNDKQSDTTDTTDTTNTTNTSETNNGDTDVSTNEGWKSLKKYDPPITITVDRYVSPDEFEKGDYWEDHEWYKWAKDTLGIIYKAKFAAVDPADKLQKLQLAIASDDLPDVVTDLTPEMVQQMASAGQLLPLQDLIEKWGSPLTKYLLEEYDKAAFGKGFTPVTYEGKWYALPLELDPWSVISNTLWIRKDLLDEVGLDIPTTVDEFEKAMEAVKAKHPDIYGFVYSVQDVDTTSFIFAAFGAYPRKWIEKDGQLVYGSIQPEVKEGLAVLRRWYENKLFDPESLASKNYWTVAPEFANGKYLSIAGPYWMYGWQIPVLGRNNPNAVVVPMDLFKNKNGEKSKYVADFTTPWPAGITHSCKHPEAVIFELNMALDSLFRNHTDLREKFEFYYPPTTPLSPSNPDEVKEKGLDAAIYDYPDEVVGPGFFKKGKPSTGGFALITYPTRANDLINRSLKIYEAVKSNTVDSLDPADKVFYEMLLTRENMQRNEMAMTAHFLNCELWRKNLDEGYILLNGFLGAPTETMKTKKAYLDKIELETFTKIIKGDLPLEAFDKFVSDWMSNGGEEITKEVNDWYRENK